MARIHEGFLMHVSSQHVFELRQRSLHQIRVNFGSDGYLDQYDDVAWFLGQFLKFLVDEVEVLLVGLEGVL